MYMQLAAGEHRHLFMMLVCYSARLFIIVILSKDGRVSHLLQLSSCLVQNVVTTLSHPGIQGTKRIVLDNFEMLLSNPATRTIFPELTLVSYRCDRNLRDYLVHSAERSDADAGTFACCHPRCLTCWHTTSQTILQSPKRLYTIRDRFTCQSENVVYSIICRRCGCLYIGETWRRLRERFSEHLRSVRNNSPGFPVAEH